MALATMDANATRPFSRLVNDKVQHLGKERLPVWMLKERTRVLYESKRADTAAATNAGSVVYWMQRDVRTADNWALLLAAHFASVQNATLRVVYALPPPPTTADDEESIPDLVNLPMTVRHGNFLLGGLECVHRELKEENIPLHVVQPDSQHLVGSAVAQLLSSLECTTVITDFSPLRHFREWIELQFLSAITSNTETVVPLAVYQVDTHNVVPVWVASDKREYGARTIRPKIDKQYHAYLQKFPKLNEFSFSTTQKSVTLPEFERDVYEEYMQMDPTVGELAWAKPGTAAGLEQAQFFFENGLSKFDTQRNDPNHSKVCSNLSPWINHGHVSFQRLTMAVKKLQKYPNGTAAYLEEGIVRRELSDNFVFYDPYRYDSLTAAVDWAQETLRVHASDPREYVYTLAELEQGQTYDDLWNAAQLQAVRDGKMHGFLRMYWAKKILEWTPSPEIALKIALYLNDKFNIDGRDPNGFVGVGWSIMGIHDMGWKEREIFGKIRFMNYAGCKRK
jgi:deoxyribodipyrimidine photo-lyase